ncbi:hypothetical protein EBB59_12215 [Lysobacter pythonis]|uniref:Uncharacterized protein n=1 Tax=Solilutibacter pythonis TaxID=2483112 RepID=A0A3M2HG08_9GAMM|nr:hypothetical protein EBB59_12215 [Lysobacter pythonis]
MSARPHGSRLTAWRCLHVRHPSPVTRHPSPVTRHPSPVTRHPSPVTRHPSPAARRPPPAGRAVCRGGEVRGTELAGNEAGRGGATVSAGQRRRPPLFRRAGAGSRPWRDAPQCLPGSSSPPGRVGRADLTLFGTRGLIPMSPHPRTGYPHDEKPSRTPDIARPPPGHARPARLGAGLGRPAWCRLRRRTRPAGRKENREEDRHVHAEGTLGHRPHGG